MDVADKIKDYSLQELKATIIRDMQSKDMLDRRYAVRFIMLDNFDTYRDLKQYLKDELNVELLELETLPLNEFGEKDMWITIDQVRNAFKHITSTTLVTPFSELARFYKDDEFASFFNELSLLEDVAHPDKRIYVPLIGLQNRMMGFLNRFSRIEESAPIWRCNTGKQEVHVYLSKYKGFNIPSDSTQHVLSTFYDWLRFWKTTAPQEKIVCTSEPIIANYEQSKPDNIFLFIPIKDASEFITHFLDVQIPFAYEENDKKYWELLLEQIDKSNPASFSFYSYVTHHFNKLHLDASEILKEWGNTNRTNYERWLLKQYALTNDELKDNKYLIKCIADTDVNNPNKLFENITELAMLKVDDMNNQLVMSERRKLMSENAILFKTLVSKNTQQWLQDKIIAAVQNGSVQWAMSLCTDTFDFEKRLYLAWYCHHHQTGKFTIAHLKLHYPEMAAYLTSQKPTDMKESNLWVIEYLTQYRAAKIEDTYTPQIDSLIKQYNADENTFYKWYHSFENSHDRLSIEKVDKIYWIDGLGAEFYPLLHYLMTSTNSNFQIEKSLFTRADLPSSTEHNRFSADNVTKFGALDELAHSSHHYQQQLTLIEEIETLKGIINQILIDNQSIPCRIAIVSDHGLSCLSRKVDSKKYSKNTEHEGRFYEISGGSLKSDSDFIIHKNETDNKTYCVALKHASLGNKPTHEVHGGCCPEEVIVPFIVLSNQKNKITYTIKEVVNKIPISNPTIEFTIIPRPQSVQLELNGQVFDMQEQENMNWAVNLTDISEGSKHIRVTPSHGNTYETEIEFYGLGFNSIDDLFS